MKAMDKLRKLGEDLRENGLPEVIENLGAEDLELYFKEIEEGNLSQAQKMGLKRFFTMVKNQGKDIIFGTELLLELGNNF